jgi:hypothetical protein
MLELAFEQGRGGVYLKLTPELYARLRQSTHFGAIWRCLAIPYRFSYLLVSNIEQSPQQSEEDTVFKYPPR